MVSIVIPNYNGERFLCAQLDSLLAQEGMKLKVLGEMIGLQWYIGFIDRL